MKDSRFIACLRARLYPIRLDKRPYGTVVIRSHVRNPRPEYRSTEINHRCRLRQPHGTLPFCNPVKDREGISECLALGVEDIIHAACQILRIVTLVLHPQVFIYGILDRLGLGCENICRCIITKDTSHLRSRGQGDIMHHIGSQTLGIIYVGRFHPDRITVLSPIDERRLALCKSGVLVIYGSDIYFERLLCNGIDLLQPFAASGNLINLPCCSNPYLPVCAARPCAACTRILHDLPLRVYLAQEACHSSLGLHVGHAEYSAVAYIPCPYSAPLQAGAKRSIRLHSVDALVDRHVIDRRLNGIRSNQCRKRRQIILTFPHEGIASEIGDYLVGTYNLSGIFPLHNLIRVDRIRIIHINMLVLTRQNQHN